MKKEAFKQQVVFPVFKSWRTTVMGILAGLTFASTDLQALIDGDPNTVANINTLITAVGIFLMGGVARDSSVSSSRSGAK